MRAYRALDSYDTGQSFAAWVLGIASNHCIDQLRRRATETRLFDNLDAEMTELESMAPAALDVLADAERSVAIQTAIATLPDKYRLPIVLAYYNESSYDEIAVSLGITRNHVGVLLLRAKQLLRRALL